MSRRLLHLVAWPLGLWLLLTVVAGIWVLPPLLMERTGPVRTEHERVGIRERLCLPGCRWERMEVHGGQGASLEAWRLHRPNPVGVAVILHGSGDDAWGTAPRLQDLPEWDAVVFTFRGRDTDPALPCTLGAWEREDVAAVVRALEAEGTPRNRMILVGHSMGAGTALMALALLEPEGGPLLGALLESPFRDLSDAARNHLRGSLGPFAWLAAPARWMALRRAGNLAGFDPGSVSPLEASRHLETPIAFLAGDQDQVTPLPGIRAMATHHPDLTVVPGAGHGDASVLVKGGWAAWAEPRLQRWRKVSERLRG